MFDVGMTSITFRKKSIEEIVGLCRKAGLDFIEWGSDVHVRPCSEDARKAAKICGDNGIGICSYGSYFLRKGYANYMEEIEKIANTCEILGTRIVRIWALNKNYDELLEEEYSRFVDVMREIAEFAEKRSLILCFEHHQKTLSDSAEHTLKLLKDIGKENVRTYWQPICEDAEENVKSAGLLGDLTVNIHVYNWIGWQNPVRFPLEDGVGKWRKYLNSFSENKNYKCLLEFVKDDDEYIFLRDAKTLKELCGK